MAGIADIVAVPADGIGTMFGLAIDAAGGDFPAQVGEGSAAEETAAGKVCGLRFSVFGGKS